MIKVVNGGWLVTGTGDTVRSVFPVLLGSGVTCSWGPRDWGWGLGRVQSVHGYGQHGGYGHGGAGGARRVQGDDPGPGSIAGGNSASQLNNTQFLIFT